MKKVLALMLALVLILSLVACGGENRNSVEKPSMTKEELLEEAQDTSIRKMGEDFSNNVSKAKDTYFNKAFKVWGDIFEIGEDYVDIRPSNEFIEDPMYVYLPNEELKELTKGNVIQVVGIITDDIEVSKQVHDQTGALQTRTLKVFTMENAHFVTDKYEIKNSIITDISYDRSSMKYTCEVSDENFDKIYVKSGQVSNEQWGNYQKYKLSASGKIKFEEVYNSEVCAVMESSDVELTNKN